MEHDVRINHETAYIDMLEYRQQMYDGILLAHYRFRVLLDYIWELPLSERRTIIGIG